MFKFKKTKKNIIHQDYATNMQVGVSAKSELAVGKSIRTRGNIRKSPAFLLHTWPRKRLSHLIIFLANRQWISELYGVQLRHTRN